MMAFFLEYAYEAQDTYHHHVGAVAAPLLINRNNKFHHIPVTKMANGNPR